MNYTSTLKGKVRQRGKKGKKVHSHKRQEKIKKIQEKEITRGKKTPTLQKT